jgi:transposase
MVTMRKHFAPAFKDKVVLEMLGEERTTGEIAAGYGVHPTQLTRWKAQVVEGLPDLFDSEKKAVGALKAAHEEEIERLYAEIGRLTTQLEWLGKESGLRTNKG